MSFFRRWSKNFDFVSDYCAQEDFHPRCGPDAVVVLTAATFGRMETGRCMPQAFGHVGCDANALPFLDQHCSNRHECQLLVFNMKKEPAFQHVCPAGLEMYLKAEYYCEKGE